MQMFLGLGVILLKFVREFLESFQVLDINSHLLDFLESMSTCYNSICPCLSIPRLTSSSSQSTGQAYPRPLKRRLVAFSDLRSVVLHY